MPNGTNRSPCQQLIPVTHSQESCTRNLQIIKEQRKQRKQQNSKSSKVYKQADQSHLSILVTCLQVSCVCSIWCKIFVQEKKLVQESTTHCQVSCTSRLVQVSCTRFLTVCHRHYTIDISIHNALRAAQLRVQVGERNIVLSVSVCLSICLSVGTHVSEATCPNFASFPVRLAWGRSWSSFSGVVMYFRFCGWRRVFL